VHEKLVESLLIIRIVWVNKMGGGGACSNKLLKYFDRKPHVKRRVCLSCYELA